MESFALATCEPNKVVSRFHNRQPVLLELEDYQQLLEGDTGDARVVLTACASERLRAYRSQPTVNNVRNKEVDVV